MRLRFIFLAIVLLPTFSIDCESAGRAIVNGWEATPFGSNEGLIHTNIRAVAEDHEGNIWLGSWGRGVFKYDGYRFMVYDYANAGIDESVRHLLTDQHGRVWAGASTGLFVHGKDGWHSAKTGVEAQDSVVSLMQLRDGRILAGTEGRVFSFQADLEDMDDAIQSRSVFLSLEQTGAANVDEIIEDDNGSLWFSLSGRGILQSRSGETALFAEPYPQFLSTRSLFQDQDGSIYAAGTDGIIVHDGREWREFSPALADVNQLARLPDGHLYVSTTHGFFVFQNEKWKRLTFSESEQGSHFYGANTASDGTVWIATKDGAYCLSHPLWNHEPLINGEAINPDTFHATVACPPIILSSSGKIMHFDQGRWRTSALPPFANVKDAECDHRGAFWILTEQTLRRLDRSTLQITNESPLPTQSEKMELECLSDGTLLLFTQDQGFILDEELEWKTAFQIPIIDESSPIECVENREEGGYWVGTAMGFGYWNDGAFTWADRLVSANKKHKIFDLLLDREKRLWFGTSVSGVLLLDNDAWTQYAIQDGLARNMTRDLFMDSGQTLWVSAHSHGLSTFRDGQWLAFSHEDGLVYDQVNKIGEFPEGTLWFALREQGIIRLEKESHAPQTQIKNISSHLAPNSLGIATIQGIDFWNQTKQEHLLYSWRIWDPKSQSATIPWSRFRSEQTIGFGPLPPGQHQLQVRAMDKFRNIEPTPAIEAINVDQYLYQRNEFIIPVAISSFITLIAIFLLMRKHFSLTQTVAALKRAQAQLIEAQRIAKIGHFVWSQDTGLMTGSSEFFRIADLPETSTPLCHRQFVDSIHPDDRERYAVAVSDMAKTGMPLRMDMRLVSKDRGVCFVHLEGALHVGEPGARVEARNVIQDVTEQTLAQQDLDRMEEQFYQSQKSEAIGRLAGGMAHNLNNILTGVIGNLSLAAMKAEKDTARFIHEASHSAERAATLIRELLHFSQRSFFILEPGDVNEVVRKAHPFIEDTFDRKIPIVIDIKENLPLVNMDKSYLHTVIMNLCLNSQEAIERIAYETSLSHRKNERFQITIQTDLQTLDGKSDNSNSPSQAGAHVVIRVLDNGIGITEENQSRVFEPFFTTNLHGNAGMGLASALGIIKKHGGLIDFRSEYGKGSMFTVYLPALPDENG